MLASHIATPLCFMWMHLVIRPFPSLLSSVTWSFLFSQARAFLWWMTKLVLSSILVGCLLSSIQREKKTRERCLVWMFVDQHENDLIVCRAPQASSCSWLRRVEHEDVHVRASSYALARSEDEAETSGRRRTHACETKGGDITWDREMESQLL